jgi:DNA polymerase-4
LTGRRQVAGTARPDLLEFSFHPEAQRLHAINDPLESVIVDPYCSYSTINGAVSHGAFLRRHNLDFIYCRWIRLRSCLVFIDNRFPLHAPRTILDFMGWFLHIDMDAFYASVEQALDPSLKNKPVLVGGGNGKGVVTSASYEARKYGVHSAMPGFQANKLCPHGIFLPNRHRVYSEYSHKVFAILRQYSPEVQAISIDEGVVDLTGTEKLLGPPLQTADRIIRRIEQELGLPSSGGVSTRRVISKIAATLAKPQGLIFVAGGDEKDFLAPLPIELVPGVGPKTQKELLKRGIRTIGELLDSELASRHLDLGESGHRQRHHEHSIGNETTLDKPLKDIEHLERILWQLVEEVGGRLRKENTYARCLVLKIRYSDFHTITRSRTLNSPTCFDREIFEIVRQLLEKNLAHDRAVRLLGVSAGALQSSGWQESLLDRDKRSSLDKLYQGIDQLRDKYGDDAIGSATSRKRRS